MKQRFTKIGRWWHKRKEHFAVFAKGFSKRIDEFEGKNVFCFDLRDMERRF